MAISPHIPAAFELGDLEQALERALGTVEATHVEISELASHLTHQVWTARPDGALDSVNERARFYFGRLSEDLVGHRWPEVLHPDDVAPALESWKRAVETGQRYTAEFRLRRADGTYRAHVARAFPITSPDGRIVKWFGTNVDVEDERAAERLAAIVESSTDAIIAKDLNGIVQSWNAGAEAMYGYSAEEVVGRSIGIIIPTERSGEMERIIASVRAGRRGRPFDTVRVRKNGEPIDVSLTVSPLLDADGAVAGASVIARDVTERRRMEAELVRRTLTDGLTGLGNRTDLENRLERALARSTGREDSLAVLFVDLDNFKLVNDSLGHSAGDRLLAAVAPRLRRSVGGEHIVSRFGGDEFVVLCETDGAQAAAEELAGRILTDLAEPFDVEGSQYVLGASIGIAVANGCSEPGSLLRDADAAMYRAKAEGRNRFGLFDDEIRREVVERVAVERELRDALARDELRLFYQPIVALGDETVVGFEALVRWQHPERGLVFPDYFLGAAESSGLIVDMGRWVLGAAVRQLAEWRDESVFVAVNLSARELSDAELVPLVRELLREHDLPGERLEIEVTEHALIDDPAAFETLTALAGLGVRVMLDDFGTGYSSLSHLNRLPIAGIKLDRSFVMAMDSDRASRAIVAAVATMASELDMAIVGEGVEEREHAETLLAYGCERGQGYHFARPCPAAEAARFLP